MSTKRNKSDRSAYASKEEQMKVIPAQLRDIAYCSYHSKPDTWYVYRRDGSVYDPLKKRSHDKRTPPDR